MRATHFRYGADRRVTTVVATPIAGGASIELDVDNLALAAGTLATSKIFLESLFVNEGKTPRLAGLMDNRQVLLPFVNWRMLGRSFEPDSYQYHQLAMVMPAQRGEEHLHGLITTLTTALAHPLVQRMPIDLRNAARLFPAFRAALGLLNLNFADSRRETSSVALHEPRSGHENRLEIRYEPRVDEARRLRRGIRRTRRALRALGCWVPPGMTHVRPMGSSVHYAGTLPMSTEPRPLASRADGRSHDFGNLWIVDGSTFPALPAKNLTLTLMANAIRIGSGAF